MDDEQRPKIPNLGYSLTLLWTVVVMAGLAVALIVLQQLRPAITEDGASVGLIQVIVYVLALAGILRLHAPDRAVSEGAALRNPGMGLLLLSPLVGIAVVAPTHGLALVTDWLIPPPQEIVEAVSERMSALDAPATAVMFGVVYGVAVPFVEELFFRGGVFGLVQREEGQRGAVVATALAFALIHWSYAPPLWALVGGLVFAILRAVSGSLWPSLLAHGTYNLIVMAALLAEAADVKTGIDLPLPALIAGWPALAAVLALFVWLARRTGAAARAREADAVVWAPEEAA